MRFRQTRLPPPMLMAMPTAGLSAAARLAVTISLMNVKSRVCAPSP